MADGHQMCVSRAPIIIRSWMFLTILVLLTLQSEQTELNVTFNTAFKLIFPEETLGKFLECLCFNGMECIFTYQYLNISNGTYNYNVSGVNDFVGNINHSHTLQYKCDKPSFTTVQENISCHQRNPCLENYCSLISHLVNVHPNCPCIEIQWAYDVSLPITYSGNCALKNGSCNDLSNQTLCSISDSQTTTKSSTLNSQTSTESSTLNSQTSTKSSTWNSQTSTKSSTLNSQTSTKSSTLDSQTSTKSSTLNSQISTKSSTLNSQTPTKSSTLNSQTSTKSSTLNSQTSTKSSTLNSQTPTKSSTLNSQTSTESSTLNSQTSTKSSIDPGYTSTVANHTSPTESETTRNPSEETSLPSTERPVITTNTGKGDFQESSSDNQVVIIGAGLGSALGIVVIIAVIALFFVWRRRKPPEQHVDKLPRSQPNSYVVKSQTFNSQKNMIAQSSRDDDYGYTDYVQPGSMYYEIDGDGELTAIRDEQFDRKRTPQETGKAKETDGITGPEDDGYNKLNTENDISSTNLATYNKGATRFVDRLPDKRSPKEDPTYSMARPISSGATAQGGGCIDLSATSPDTSRNSETDYFELEAVKDEDCCDEIDMETNSILEDSDPKNDYFQLEPAEDEDDDGDMVESEDSIAGNSETVSDPKNDFFQLESVEEQDKSD